MEVANIIYNQQNYIMLQCHPQRNIKCISCENIHQNFIQET